ncbi:hypothetical protein L6164_002072, partial [Bauhinia variegata]
TSSTFKDGDLIEELEICEKIESELGSISGQRQLHGQHQNHHQTGSETQTQPMHVD